MNKNRFPEFTSHQYIPLSPTPYHLKIINDAIRYKLTHETNTYNTLLKTTPYVGSDGTRYYLITETLRDQYTHIITHVDSFPHIDTQRKYVAELTRFVNYLDTHNPTFDWITLSTFDYITFSLATYFNLPSHTNEYADDIMRLFHTYMSTDIWTLKATYLTHTPDAQFQYVEDSIMSA
jgi:hypothetical protein